MAIDGGLIRLSRRELEVAALVAEGLTDREIAKRLFLSDRTAEGHVQSIRNKLGFDTRAQVATWYARRSLTGSTGAGPGVHGNLPLQLTSFVGRGMELSEVRRLMDRTRLVTITGPGGAGKTRLAIHAGQELQTRHPGGVWFVDLGAVTSPDAVLMSLAAVLGVRESEGSDLLEGIRTHFAGDSQACLLVLDNCEHLIDSCASVAEAVLRSNPQVRILCTSREPLLVSGEAVSKLAPLSLPAATGALSVDEVRRAEAVQLFCDRASLSAPQIQLDDSNHQEVAQICRDLEGIPLALELGAAQVGMLTLAGVRSGIANGFGLLRRRGGAPRHRALDAAVRWSYDLLNPAEQRLVRRLAVFRGGFSTEAAAGICGEEAGLLATIADKSLVTREPNHQRWRMLETIRQCAEEWLGDAGELELMRDRHLDHFLALARQAEPSLAGPEQAAWLEKLGADHDNLTAALRASHLREEEDQLGMAHALYRFWSIRGHLSEGRTWLEDALRGRGAASPMRARTLNSAAGIAWRQGDFASARQHLESGLAIWRALGDPAGMEPCLANLGVIAASQGDFAGAVGYYREGLELAEAAGQRRAVAILQSNLGLALMSLGDEPLAEATMTRSLAALRELGEPGLIGAGLLNLGIFHLHRGDHQTAQPVLWESLALLSAIGGTPDVADCLEKLGWAAAAGGDPERAVRLAGAAEGIRRRVGAPSSPSARERMESVIAGARAALGPSADEVWADGLEMTVGDAVNLGRQP